MNKDLEVTLAAEAEVIKGCGQGGCCKDNKEDKE